MLENIRFCFCFSPDLDDEKEKRCMTFSFTERARKTLTFDFLYQITLSDSEEDESKTGIPLTNNEKEYLEKTFVKKLDENLYRIPVKYMDPFIRCLFKYLPATFVPVEENSRQTSCNTSCSEKV